MQKGREKKGTGESKKINKKKESEAEKKSGESDKERKTE